MRFTPLEKTASRIRWLRLAGAALVVLAAAAPATAAMAAPGAVSVARQLEGVTCPRAGSCWAVGGQTLSGKTGPLIEHWTGRKWVVAHTPAAPGAALYAVSCLSRSSCWAVGGATPGSETHASIAEHWNGQKWSLRVVPQPAGSEGAILTGVSCPSAGRCWAVGGTDPFRLGGTALAEHWTGKRWSVVPTPAFAAADLAAVACRSDVNCWAVGGDVGGPPPRTGHWNGTRWRSVAAAPNTGGGLGAVACPGRQCVAAGAGGFPSAIAERWTGTRWTLLSIPPIQGLNFSNLRGLACFSATNCIGVGSYGTGSVIKTFVLRLRRSKWTQVRSPNPARAGLAQLGGLSCTGRTNCWAVGWKSKSTFGTPDATLAEHWNGSHWSTVATP